ncbi:MAG: holo-ACP synthase [Kofleriaceae bacterium]|nr:holo-ACP synthase [Myxococcales bacterium]MCB9565295.1 holo-ACP synthase [Kofleriaceae bacterium]
MSLRVGIDLVQVSRIAESLAEFGDRFLRRLYTDGEIAYATAAPALTHARLAARFAAKEAALKALGLGGEGVDWRQIEVRRASSGACELALHGATAQHARDLGIAELALSLSHEGDYATAVVVSTSNVPTSPTP